MKQIKNGELEYIIFDNLESTEMVKHCFTTRRGGVSKGCFESLNLSFKRGDTKENVEQNYKRICDAVKIEYHNIVMACQSHTTNIHVATQADRGKGILIENDIIDTDGLVTNIAGLALVIFGADCVPIFFADTVKRVIGVCHAGWRGTVNGIGAKMIHTMREKYNSKAENIVVGIGPSIGLCCFQVDTPVAEEFYNKLNFAEKIIKPDTEKGKYKIDLWNTNKLLLMEAGVLENNIEIAGLCTKCHCELFYSHRIMGEKRGVMAGMIELEK